MLVFGDLPARCDILIFKYIVSESSNLSVSVLCISLLMLLENITSLEYLGALGVEIWQYSYASLYNVHCLWKHQRVSCRYGGIICSSVPLPLSLKYFIFVSLVYRLFSVFCTSIMHSGWQISIGDRRLLSISLYNEFDIMLLAAFASPTLHFLKQPPDPPAPPSFLQIQAIDTCP